MAQRKVTQSRPKKNDINALITEGEFYELQKLAFALYGAHRLMDRCMEDIEAVEIAALLAPITDGLCDFVDHLHGRLEKGRMQFDGGDEPKTPGPVIAFQQNKEGGQ